MMLRRLAGNLRRQDWTAVVIELVVVIVGVFIGLQASNWNEERGTSAKAQVFTERLKADLLAEAWGYEMQIGYHSDVLSNAEKAADALDGLTPLPEEALLVAAYRATQYNSNTRRRATYDELTSTGEMGLIRDEALRVLAMDVYTSTMFDIMDDEGINSPYRKAFRTTLPYRIQRALASACGDKTVAVGDYDGIKNSLDYRCSTGLAADVIAENVAALRANRDLVGLLRLRIADVETSLFNLATYYKDIRESLARLAKEAAAR
jgi:hypothetical protein